MSNLEAIRERVAEAREAHKPKRASSDTVLDRYSWECECGWFFSGPMADKLSSSVSEHELDAILAAVSAHIEEGLDAAYYEMGEHIALEAAPDTLAAALRALDLLPDPQGEGR